MPRKPLLSLYKKHPVLAGLCVLTALTGASAYLYLKPDVYQSQVVVATAGPSSSSHLLSSTKTPLTEEVTSASFIQSAIETAVNPVTFYITQDLKTSANAYGFPYLVSFKATGTGFAKQSYQVEEMAGDQYRLINKELPISRIKTGTFGEELIDQNLSITLTKKKNKPYLPSELLFPATYSFTIQSPASMAASLTSDKKRVTANEENGVLTIRCTDEDPKRTQQLAQALGEQFVASRNGKLTEGLSGTSEIDEKLEAVSAKLQATEQQIADYKKQNNITDINFDTEKSLAVLKELQLQKTQLEMQRVTLDNTSKYLRNNRDGNNSNVEYGAITDPVFSEQLEQLNAKYAAKENGTATAQTDSEIAAMKTQIAERIRNTRKKTAVQLARIDQEIAATREQLSVLPEKATALNQLDRQLTLDKKVYDLLVEKRAQALAGIVAPQGQVQILKPASPPVATGIPHWLVLAGSIIAGLFLALPFIRLAETRSAQRIHRREEITSRSRIPFIGSISVSHATAKGIPASVSDLCTRILLHEGARFLTFASSGKGEGKTFIATRIGQAFAAMDKKVLLIDMNHEDPAAASHFEVTPERSLADVLEGKCDIHDAISLTSYPNLDVLAFGELASGVNSLLASKKREAIMNDLRKHYDIIITDTPDLGTKIDAVPMMKMSDLSFFVVRANTTRKQSLHVAEELKKDYSLDNLYFLLNTLPSGAGRKSNLRSISTHDNAVKPKYVPEMLRKIALWFY